MRWTREIVRAQPRFVFNNLAQTLELTREQLHRPLFFLFKLFYLRPGDLPRDRRPASERGARTAGRPGAELGVAGIGAMGAPSGQTPVLSVCFREDWSCQVLHSQA